MVHPKGMGKKGVLGAGMDISFPSLQPDVGLLNWQILHEDT